MGGRSSASTSSTNYNETDNSSAIGDNGAVVASNGATVNINDLSDEAVERVLDLAYDLAYENNETFQDVLDSGRGMYNTAAAQLENSAMHQANFLTEALDYQEASNDKLFEMFERVGDFAETNVAATMEANERVLNGFQEATEDLAIEKANGGQAEMMRYALIGLAFVGAVSAWRN